MRKIILSVLMCLPIFAIAQPLSFSESVNIDVNASELSKRANEWLSANTSGVEKNDNIYVGKSSFIYNPTIFYGSLGTKGVVEYKVLITIQDNGYKYNITNFTHQGNANNEVNLSFGLITVDEEYPNHMKGQRKGWENKIWRELKKVSEEQAHTIMNSLKKSIANAN